MPMKPRKLDEIIQEAVFLKFFLGELFSKNAWVRFKYRRNHAHVFWYTS